jgi:modulator of FtsH protease HflK
VTVFGDSSTPSKGLRRRRSGEPLGLGALWRGAAAIVAVLALVGWLGSGFHVLAADERGVVRRFGAITAQLGPGMHYVLPWPVSRVDVVKSTSVLKEGAGFRFAGQETEALTGIELLTGDTNILSIALVLQFVIRDPAGFLTRIEQPRELVELLAQCVLTETVATMPVDGVLTTGRLAIQDRVRVRTQTLLDRERSGIQITSASIMAITLDRSVAESFQDVADATADREKTINEAHSYANALLPKARGDAAGTLGDAQNYKRQVAAKAEGEAERFLAVLGEYERAPSVLRTKIYFEEVEKTLRRPKIYVIDSQESGGRLSVRLIAP